MEETATTTSEPTRSPSIDAGAHPLLKEVEDRRREIRTDGYSMSIGELASLYEENEMDIQPRFQRFFRWSDEQKTALVESVLLGIPLPPIFVSAREDGVWEVVDGMQRLSTFFQVMGKLRPEHRTSRVSGESILRFTKAKHLYLLEGRDWRSLPKPLQLDFRRAKIGVNIIMRGGDPRAKFDLFERLNTGGNQLSEQEVRNCLLVMENEDFFNWLERLSEHPKFRECAAVSERFEDQGYHKELVSRFLIFSDIGEESLKGIGDIAPFVNGKMLEMARGDAACLKEHAKVFEGTFAILSAPEIGDRAFKRYSAKEERFKGSFLISPFEVVACGIAHHLARGKSVNDFPPEIVLKKIQGIWEGRGLLENIKGSGRKGSNRLPRTIPYGREKFQP